MQEHSSRPDEPQPSQPDQPAEPAQPVTGSARTTGNSADGTPLDSVAAKEPGNGTAGPPGKWWAGRRRLAWTAGAAVSATVLAGASLVVAGGLSSRSAIPSPPRANKMFVEDEEGTGADSQANILQSTAPGLVHIVSAHGTSAGVGIVLTWSGLVLTSAQVVRGAGQVLVREALSARSFDATVTGSAQGLALLQIRSGSDLKPIAVGNSDRFAVGAAVTAVGSIRLTRTFTLNVGNITSRAAMASVSGQRLTGLFQSTTRVQPGEETGGPLVNLSGQVIGIDVAGAGSGLHHVGFAVPINEALAVARQIESGHDG